MRLALMVHVIAGALALLVGTVALVARKGQTLHRKSGLLFVAVMLVMTSFGALIAAIEPAAPAVNIPAAVMTAYLVITSLTTVRSLGSSRWLDMGLMLLALVVGATELVWGFQAIASADGRKFGFPSFPFFLFGVIGMLGGVGDLRMIRSGGLRGASRIARHLWRMCLALWIAAASFFLGPRARVRAVLPDVLVTTPVLVIPVIAVIVVMLYWLWRVRVRKAFAAGVHVHAHEAI